jgi:hypothetical protein
MLPENIQRGSTRPVVMSNENPRAVEEILKEQRLPLIVSFYRRIPSRHNIVYAYLACLFPIQVWSIYNLLREVPAWLRQMSASDVIGVASYSQTFVLFESVVIFLPLVFLSTLFPAGWFRDEFVSLSTGVVYLSVVWSVLAHINDPALRHWRWIGLFLVSQILLFFLIHYSDKLKSIIGSFVDRVAVLSVLYLLIDLLSVLIVVIRNV